jgi:hypothetical protein
MKLLGAAVVALIVALTGCASSLHAATEPDAICREIADLANASSDGLLHQVRLMNDWGGLYCSSGPDEVAIACKACNHDAYGPGKRLCGYLMENTSTEFSGLNFIRVLRCLSDRYEHLTPGPEVEGMTNRQIWSTKARWVRPGVSVGVEYLPSEKNEPNTLVVFAQRRRAS